MKKKPHYVEFVGQHTAGKTSTIQAIVDNEMLAPIAAMYPQQITRNNWHFYSVLPFLCVRQLPSLLFVLHFMLRYGSWRYTNYHAVGRHLIKMVVLHPYYERFPADVWFKDDMLHLLPRIQFRPTVDVRRVLEKYVEHFMQRYDGLVFIDVAVDVMRERFAERFKDRPTARREDRRIVYERAYTQNLFLKEILQNQTSVPVLFLEGEQSIEANAAAVVAFVREKVVS